jgi:cyclopropane-fatty-acyl-phospholipid synthase
MQGLIGGEMGNAKMKQTIQQILDLAEVKINGTEPWDIQVHDDRLYRRILAQGSVGLGESYMDGWWDCSALDEFFYRVLKAELQKKVRGRGFIKAVLVSRLTNLQTKPRSFIVGKRHYDLGNKHYENMLDKRMVYSCGYWKDADSLDEAQEAKLDLICRKVELKPGMKVLDIGCGWGSFAKYAAERYGVSVVGITVSKEQVKLGRELCNGLPVEIRLQDYRDVEEKFDAIVSIGMFEHVGYKNYATFMNTVYNCLDDEGFFLLHTIGSNESGINCDPWTVKYIFPNSMLPSVKQIATASEGKFYMEDWHNFGLDYDKTLMVWYRNFINNWDKIKDDYDKRFKRMWEYFLMSSAGGFRSRHNQLWQVVFSKKGGIRGYTSIR